MHRASQQGKEDGINTLRSCHLFASKPRKIKLCNYHCLHATHTPQILVPHGLETIFIFHPDNPPALHRLEHGEVGRQNRRAKGASPRYHSSKPQEGSSRSPPSRRHRASHTALRPPGPSAEPPQSPPRAPPRARPPPLLSSHLASPQRTAAGSGGGRRPDPPVLAAAAAAAAAPGRPRRGERLPSAPGPRPGPRPRQRHRARAAAPRGLGGAGAGGRPRRKAAAPAATRPRPPVRAWGSSP